MLGCAAALVLAGLLRAQATPATVTIDFLPDGRCAVSAQGEGFRSNATYTPEGARDPGELRCAMPPVPKDRTVNLTVSLPTGVDRPGSSEPRLVWARSGDHWSGAATLTQWPDAVVISRASRFWTLWFPGGLLVVLLAAVQRRRRRRRTTAGSA